MNGLSERLERCEREIALALAESQRPHTPMEHTGILLWEMDWRLERENILREVVSEALEPSKKGGFCECLRQSEGVCLKCLRGIVKRHIAEPT